MSVFDFLGGATGGAFAVVDIGAKLRENAKIGEVTSTSFAGGTPISTGAQLGLPSILSAQSGAVGFVLASPGLPPIAGTLPVPGVQGPPIDLGNTPPLSGPPGQGAPPGLLDFGGPGAPTILGVGALSDELRRAMKLTKKQNRALKGIEKRFGKAASSGVLKDLLGERFAKTTTNTVKSLHYLQKGLKFAGMHVHIPGLETAGAIISGRWLPKILSGGIARTAILGGAATLGGLAAMKLLALLGPIGQLVGIGVPAELGSGDVPADELVPISVAAIRAQRLTPPKATSPAAARATRATRATSSARSAATLPSMDSLQEISVSAARLPQPKPTPFSGKAIVQRAAQQAATVRASRGTLAQRLAQVSPLVGLAGLIPLGSRKPGTFATPASTLPVAQAATTTLLLGSSPLASSAGHDANCSCKRKRGVQRKCLERAGVVYKTGRYKGKAAGTKCLRYAT